MGYKPPYTQVERTCLHCGKRFMVFNFRKDSVKYCSHKCHGLHVRSKVQKNCLYCGKPFLVIPARQERRKYCSLKCRNECPQNKKKKVSFSHSIPNKAETKVNEAMIALGLPYRYVGNGEVWIAGLNPDFINTNSQKKIVELFGERWHQGNVRLALKEDVRKSIFKQYGYDTLVIWCKELKDMDAVKQKLIAFNNAPHGAQ